MNFYVLNRQEELLTILSNEDGENSPIYKAILKEQLDKMYTLDLEISSKSTQAQYIVEENYVLFKDLLGEWQLYIIKEVTEEHSTEHTKFVYCENASQELLDDMCGFDILGSPFTPDILLTGVLTGTRWQVGNVSNLAAHTAVATTKNKSALEAIHSIMGEYGLQVAFRYKVVGNQITNRYVDLKVNIGNDYGKRFEYSKDVEKIERIVNTTDLKTAIIPMGGVLPEEVSVEGENPSVHNTTPIDITGVIWAELPFLKPLGQAYLEDTAATALWGYGTGTKRPRFVFYENTEITDPELLIIKAYEVLQALSVPKITYKMNVVDLYAMSGSSDLSHESIRTGDLTVIVDTEFTPVLAVKNTIIERVINLLCPEDSTVTLGKYINSLSDGSTSNITTSINNALQKYRPSEFGNGFYSETAKINDQAFHESTGYTYIKDTEGVWVYDSPSDETPNKMVALKGGKLGIGKWNAATQKWDITTFIDGDSVNASAINTGTLNAELVNVKGLEVGKNVIMGADAVISWANLSPESKSNLKGEQGIQGITGSQGVQGVTGSQGIQGITGANGIQYYTWLKYADTPTTGMSDSPTGKTYMGIAINKLSNVESIVYGDYTWSLIKGDIGATGATGSQGITGSQGVPGTNAIQYYTWLKYALTPTTGMSDSPDGMVYMGIAYNKTSATESSAYADYSWSLIKGDTGSQGVQGIQGVTGANGQATYTWVKYATSATGTGINDSPTGMTYIGLAFNKTTATESGVTTDYSWSLIQGATGSTGLQGIQGTTGANGLPTYTWMKYATSATGTGLSDLPAGMTYVGFAYNKTTAVESTTATDYLWSLIKGDTGATGATGSQGIQGIQGIAGPTGANGAVTYTWIKYATTPTTGMVDLPDGKAYMGIAYNKTTAVESTVYTDYSWSLIQGATGSTGATGANGATTYTWIKYADTTTTGMSDSPTGKIYMGIAYNKTTATKSVVYTDYAWSLIKGDTGATGAAGSNANVPAYITATKITQVAIESPTITGGTITGTTLKTSNTTSFVTIQNQYVNLSVAGKVQLKLGIDETWAYDKYPYIAFGPDCETVLNMKNYIWYSQNDLITGQAGGRITLKGANKLSLLSDGECVINSDGDMYLHAPNIFANGVLTTTNIDLGVTAILAGANNLTIDTEYGNSSIGMENTGYCHIRTEAAMFFVEKRTQFGSHIEPYSANLYYNGLSGTGWKGVYAYALVNLSDRSLKENIIKIDNVNSYEIIKNMNTYNYNYKDDERVMVGVIADEMPMEIIDTEDFKGVDLYALTTISVSALKECMAKIEALEAELIKLGGSI